jgi:hypothetical protein
MHSSEDSQKNMSDLGGKWLGKIETGGKESDVQVNFTNVRIISASIRLPNHDRRFIPLINAEYQPPNIHFEYADTDVRGVFDGTLNNNIMSGSFNRNGESGNFKLTKAPDDGEDRNQHYYSDLNYPQ